MRWDNGIKWKSTEESMAVTRASLVDPRAIVYDETIRFHRFGSVSPLYDSFDWKVPAGSIGTRPVWNASAFDMKL